MYFYYIISILIYYWSVHMKYKILVLDIDGTLTNSKKEISPKTKKALMKAQAKGVKLVIASGRPTYGVEPLANELELSKYGGYILSFNGAKIINCETNEIMYEKNIPQDKLPEIYDLSKEQNVNILTYEGDTILTEEPDDKYIAIESRVNKMSVKKVDSFKDYIKSPVTKCLMVAEGDFLANVETIVKNKVGNDLNVYRSEPFFLEIMPKNIDKAYSLNQLLKKINMTRDEMIACGDGFNDKSMIDFAGLGVAMENAQEEVKDVADYITLSNDNDGIAKVVEKFILNC